MQSPARPIYLWQQAPERIHQPKALLNQSNDIKANINLYKEHEVDHKQWRPHACRTYFLPRGHFLSIEDFFQVAPLVDLVEVCAAGRCEDIEVDCEDEWREEIEDEEKVVTSIL